MARYIKANRLVAEFLHLENDRNKLNDGNYLLWQQDMLEFGPLPQLNETLVMIGGLALLPHEAREEQDGVISRPLPIATDPRFILPDPTPEPEPEENDGESQGEKIWHSMLDTELMQNVAKSGGVGIADMMYDNLIDQVTSQTLAAKGKIDAPK